MSELRMSRSVSTRVFSIKVLQSFMQYCKYFGRLKFRTVSVIFGQFFVRIYLQVRYVLVLNIKSSAMPIVLLFLIDNFPKACFSVFHGCGQQCNTLVLFHRQFLVVRAFTYLENLCSNDCKPIQNCRITTRPSLLLICFFCVDQKAQCQR